MVNLFFVGTARHPWLYHLACGPHKPMGYLPICALHKWGFDPQSVARDFRESGCSTARFSSIACRIGFRGALFAWHEQSLKRLLDTFKTVLEDWPTSTRAFVDRVATESVLEGMNPTLYKCIGQAFGDDRFPPALVPAEQLARSPGGTWAPIVW